MSILTPLTNKECDKVFPPWTADHQAAFEQIKRLVLSTDCLTIINYKEKASNIYVTTDASNRRTGTVLIVKALKKWRSHLLGARFEVFTDHQILKYFQSQKEMSRRQMRWSMYLTDFDYSITYIRGEDNTAADALSRMPDAAPDACLVACAIAYTCNAPPTPIAGILNIAADHSLLDAIINGYRTDDFAKKLMKDIDMGSIKGATSFMLVAGS
jgi:hypothetical protein